MKSLTKTAQKVFAAAIARLGEGQHVKIDAAAGTYMALVVEQIGTTRYAGPRADGKPATVYPVYSFAHYGEQNGDAMRDPDVTMMRCPSTGDLYPITFRNDWIGKSDEALVYDDNGYIRGHRPKMQASITSFCTTWAANLKHQQGLGK